ncbi:MAG: hypothetical protein LBL42_03495 [Tannerella sp.]|nr:hypothetical protein [Tannerella sp.]
MVTLTTCIRGRIKKNGTYPVYIRLSHHTKKAYINTELFVLKKHVDVLYDKNGTYGVYPKMSFSAFIDSLPEVPADLPLERAIFPGAFLARTNVLFLQRRRFPLRRGNGRGNA